MSARRTWTLEEDQKIQLLYRNGMGYARVAREFHTNQRQIRERLRIAGVVIHSKGRQGPQNPAWKGGRRIDADGYVQVYAPLHPDARNDGTVLEHRLVMETVLGRRLQKEEVVHHLNGNKQDNDPSNLRLFSTNGDHLAVDLLGKLPNWTPDGHRRILAKRRPSTKGIPRPNYGNGAALKRKRMLQAFLHETSQLADTAPEVLLPPLPAARQRPKQSRETASPPAVVRRRITRIDP